MVRRIFALVLLGLLMAGLAGLASWSATQQVELHGAFAVAVRGDRVLVSAGNEVLLLDDSGALQAVLSDAAGVPWRFDDISNVNFTDDGGALVCDATRHEVVRFDADGRNGRRLPLIEPPRLSFEAVDLGDGLFIADTMRHEVRVTDAEGRTIKRRRVMYPNGAQRVPGSDTQVALAATGSSRALVYEVSTLTPSEPPPFDALNGHTVPGAHPEVFELALLPGGAALVASCRDPQGECSFLRLGGDAPGVVGDTLPFTVAVAETTEGTLGTGEIAALADGSLLVASPRLGVVLRFFGDAGPPPAGFCDACTEATLASPPTEVWTLETAGYQRPTGGRVSLFGGAALLGRFRAVHTARARLWRLESGARWGSYAVAAALLVLLFLMRQAGATGEAVGGRVGLVWRTLVRPHLRLYVAAWALGAVAVSVGAAVGWWLRGPGAALAGGALVGVVAARWVLAPFLASRLPPGAARAAAQLHLASLKLEDGEQIRWATFAWPRRTVSSAAADAAEGGGVDDWFELLETLAPQLVLLVRTERRLVAVRTSMLGAPQEEALSLPVALAADEPPPAALGLLTVDTARATRAWRLGPGAGALKLFSEGARWLCADCHAPAGTCAHRGEGAGPALLATLLLPGVGHLITGDFGKARTLLIASAGLLLEALRQWLPQYIGTLPPDTSAWLPPLLAYAGAGLAGAGALLLDAHRRRSRQRPHA